MLRRVAAKPFFKNAKPSATVQRRLRKLAADNAEDTAKARVRRRDKGCRFPLCGCRRLRLPLEVSHNEHKGSGGNPAGDRSDDRLLMQLCRERHRTAWFSVHTHRIEWAPLSKREGSNGPVRWLVDLGQFNHYALGRGTALATRVVEVARETSVGVAVIDERYRYVLEDLASMEL